LSAEEAEMGEDTLLFYQGGLLKKQWRWRYFTAGNYEKLGNGGESYGKVDDCIEGGFRVCGISNYVPEVTETKVDTLIERPEGVSVMVRFR
jgi:hypothetical protein